MSKICTSIEQSKRLLELGLNPDTADMCYCPIMDIDSMSNTGFLKIPDCYPFSEVKDCKVQYLPAWSLSALFKILPPQFEGTNDFGTFRYEIKIRKYKSTVDLYQIAYGNYVDEQYDNWKDMINTGQKEDFLDAAFDMVCLLLELKKI